MNRRWPPIETGKKYGRLTAIEPCGPVGSEGRKGWLFRCDCGNDYRGLGRNVSRGTTRSCGCYGTESRKARMTTHGKGSGKKGRQDRAYQTWARIISRCESPNENNFADYGGRGIRVCEKWRESFVSFFLDMGDPPSPLHSIDRIDVNGNYEPGNCRWATAKEQARNRRSNRMVTIGGTTRCLAEWIDELGIKLGTVEARVYRNGWTYEAALTTPVRKWGIK